MTAAEPWTPDDLAGVDAVMPVIRPATLALALDALEGHLRRYIYFGSRA